MESGMIKLIGLGLFFFGIFFLVFSLLPKSGTERPRKPENAISPGDEARFLLLFKPFYQLFNPVIERLPLGAYRKRIEKYVITAGLDDEVKSGDVIGFQICVTILFGLCGFLLFDSFFNRFLSVLVGVIYPYLWLYGKMKQRQEQIKLSMPDVVDMLSLTVEAGLAFPVAVQKVCEIYRNSKNPFVVELYFMDQNIKLGRSRSEALRIMADRIDIMELESFVSTLIQAEKMGTSISAVLKSQAQRMRNERFMKAERIGAQASQKMLIPMMLFIFPIIFGPYLVKFLVE